MLKIELTKKSFLINNQAFQFPIKLEELKKIIGEPRKAVLKYGIAYTFDDYGIHASSNNGTDVERLMIWFLDKGFKFSPETLFKGELILDGEEARALFKNNRSKLVKVFEDDTSGAIILNETRAWFGLDSDDKNLEYIEIKKNDTPIPDFNVKTIVPLEKKFKYLEALWQNWIHAIEKKNTSGHKYFNLRSGISSEKINEAKKMKEPKIHEELIQFYQFRDVKYNPVASLFEFTFNGYIYYLNSFDRIKSTWEEIQDLQTNDREELSFGKLSKRIKIDNYTNEKWIPIADDYNGNYLLYDCDPGSEGHVGQIVELQNESWERRVVADSLQDLIEKQIEKIKTDVTPA